MAVVKFPMEHLGSTSTFGSTDNTLTITFELTDIPAGTDRLVVMNIGFVNITADVGSKSLDSVTLDGEISVLSVAYANDQSVNGDSGARFEGWKIPDGITSATLVLTFAGIADTSREVKARAHYFSNYHEDIDSTVSNNLFFDDQGTTVDFDTATPGDLLFLATAMLVEGTGNEDDITLSGGDEFAPASIEESRIAYGFPDDNETREAWLVAPDGPTQISALTTLTAPDGVRGVYFGVRQRFEVAANVRLTWTAAETIGPAFEAYKIYRAPEDSDAEFVLLDTLPVDFTQYAAGEDGIPTTYTDETSEVGNTYRYRIDAVDGDGHVLRSNVVTVEVVGVIPPVTPVLTGELDDNDIELSWTNGEGTFPVSHYRVFRDGDFYDTTTSQTYTDADVAPGIYEYYVVAVDIYNNESASSNVVSVSYIPALATPVLDGYAITEAIELAWSEPGPGEFPTPTFEIYRSIEGGDFVLLDTVGEGIYTYTDNIGSVDPDETYSYYVRALDGFGNTAQSNTVDVFISFGSLFALSPATVATGNFPPELEIHVLNDDFLYVPSAEGDVVYQYAIAGNGTISSLSPANVAGGNAPVYVKQTPNGSFAYALGLDPTTIQQYSVGGDGKLTALSPFTIGPFPVGNGVITRPTAFAITPDSAYLYCVDRRNDVIRQFSIGVTGQLTPLSPATVSCGNGTEAICITPDGAYVYCTAENSNAIFQFSVGPAGHLTALSPASVAAGITLANITITPDGQYVFAVNYNASTFRSYVVNSNGQLTPNPVSPVIATATNPTTVSIHPSGKHVYVTSFADEVVAQYHLRADGTIVEMFIPTVSTGSYPEGLKVTSDGKYAYVPNFFSHNISQYGVRGY